jgi:hypothetical protein
VFGEEPKRATEETQAGCGGAALAASHFDGLDGGLVRPARAADRCIQF